MWRINPNWHSHNLDSMQLFLDLTMVAPRLKPKFQAPPPAF